MGFKFSKSSKSTELPENDFMYSYNFSSSESPLFYKLDSDELNVRCKNSNKRYTNFSKFIEDENFKWKDAECTINGIRKYRPDVRKLNHCEDSFEIFCMTLSTFIKVNKLEIEGSFDLLKYTAGSFSLTHTDRIGDFTCLFFLANSKHTGGELVFYDTSKVSSENLTGRTCIDTSKFEFDTMVVFPVGMPHEVLKVTSGERYVLKGSLKLPYREPIIYISEVRTNVKD